MRIGIVCPYAFDVPGGVQFHVRDIAERCIRRATRSGSWRPPRATPTSPRRSPRSVRPVPVRYNGSVARVTLGPATSARVRRWVEAGDFDVLHLHEPLNPVVCMLALWIACPEPVVATFHSACSGPARCTSPTRWSGSPGEDQRADRGVRGRPGDRAACTSGGSRHHPQRRARRLVRARRYARVGGHARAPTVAFLGRVDESRKGLAVAARRDARGARRVPRHATGRRRAGGGERPAQGADDADAGRPFPRDGERRRQGVAVALRRRLPARRTSAASRSASCSSRRWRRGRPSSPPTCRPSPGARRRRERHAVRDRVAAGAGARGARAAGRPRAR